VEHGPYCANAGDERLVRIGADHATAVPAATRLRAFLREILSKAQPSGFSLSMSIPPRSGLIPWPRMRGTRRRNIPYPGDSWYDWSA
jgi:hypothetical protein